MGDHPLFVGSVPPHHRLLGLLHAADAERGNKALSFGKSKRSCRPARRRRSPSRTSRASTKRRTSSEIIEFLKEPQKFQKLGGRIPKACSDGPPGTGKTLLARAVAGEANVPFFSISGSDFVEMFVGVGASPVQDLFEQGKKNAPCIVFIDEIDAVGRHRGAGRRPRRARADAQPAARRDGRLRVEQGVILVAATNRPDVLDPALLRRPLRPAHRGQPSGREGREGILSVHTRKIPMADDVEIAVLARARRLLGAIWRPGERSGAQRRAFNQKTVRMHDFEFAKDKVLMGSERAR